MVTEQFASRDPVRAGILTGDLSLPGGVKTHAATVTEILKGWGAEVELLYTRGSRKGGLRAESISHFGVQAHEFPRLDIPFSWTITPCLFGRTWLNTYDLNIAVTGSCHVAFPFTLLGRPYIVWLASLYKDELRAQVAAGDSHADELLTSPLWRLLAAQERFVLRRAARVIANSPYTAERVGAFAPEIRGRTDTIIIPIDTDFFRPACGVATTPRGDYLLLAARTDDGRKNIPLVLRSFAVVRSRFPNLRLVICGGGITDVLREQTHALNLEEAVVFAGLVSRERLRQLYQDALLVILGSRQEGLGLVLLEAMACGTPVVSTRSGGPDHLLEGHPEVGRLTPNEDTEAFAAAILELLGDRDVLARMRTSCRSFVEENYSMQSASRQLLAIVETIYPHVVTRLRRFTTESRLQ